MRWTGVGESLFLLARAGRMWYFVEREICVFRFARYGSFDGDTGYHGRGDADVRE